MNTMTYEPEYISISLKPRIIAAGKGLLAFAFFIHQGWYLVLFEHNLWITWSNSIAILKDPINSLLSMLLHAGLSGIVLGYAVIALRSAATGYAPTKGTVTFRSFGARYSTLPSGHVDISEESHSNPVGFVASRCLEEENIDVRSREEAPPSDIPHTENTSLQEETHGKQYAGELLVEEAPHKDEQDIQPRGTTRALIVCPVRLEDRGAPAAQAPQEIAQIRKVLYFLISFFGRLTVSAVLAIGSSVKQCQVNLDNRLKSFTAYLATRVKGKRLIWDDFINRVFHSVERGSLDQAKYDLNKKVNEALQTLDPTHPTIVVFEQRENKKSSDKKHSTFTALFHDWYPDEPLAELLAYHSIVRDMQADPAHTFDIPLEKLRPVYKKVIPAYKEKGFLGEHLEHDEDDRWCWAEAPYLYIRDGQLIFIIYCAGCEEKASQQTDDPQTQQECREQEAWLWREAIYTAMSYLPDLERGEYALRRYLTVCDLLGWREVAKGVVNQYYRLLARHAPGEKLRAETLTLIAKVTMPHQKVDQDAKDEE